MAFGRRLKQYRLDHELSQDQLAEILHTSKQVISRYETEQRSPKITIVQEYAEQLGVPLSYFTEEYPPNVLPLPNMRKVPLLGTIACGTPILAAENLDGYVKMPENVHADFCLRCKGDSMIGARIMDGDLVFIHQQPDVDNGAIAAVIVEDEATLKRIYKSTGKIILQPENPRYEPFVFVGEELSQIRIIGKAVAFLSGVE